MHVIAPSMQLYRLYLYYNSLRMRWTGRLSMWHFCFRLITRSSLDSRSRNSAGNFGEVWHAHFLWKENYLSSDPSGRRPPLLRDH